MYEAIKSGYKNMRYIGFCGVQIYNKTIVELNKYLNEQTWNTEFNKVQWEPSR